MVNPTLPKNVRRVADNEPFNFACHPGISCFTDCCRELELALTPYDVLRMRKETGLHSNDFLDTYVIIEQEPAEQFPRFYLTMVDDGRASCVFVSEKGCTIYNGRPGACRAYPMGRAASRREDNSFEEFHVILTESHCYGFKEQEEQTVARYSREQGLTEYNHFNDAIVEIVQHPQIRQGLELSRQQVEHFILALYNLDTFRDMISKGAIQPAPLDTEKDKIMQDDEMLLLFGIKWLKTVLFSERDI